MTDHYAGELITVALQKEAGPLAKDELRERANVGAEDFEAALAELIAEGAVSPGGYQGELIFLAGDPEAPVDALPPAAEAEPAADTVPPATFTLHHTNPLALLAAEAARSARPLVVNARVRFRQNADGLQVVTEVLEVYGVDLG